MPYSLPRLPEGASDELRLAYAAAGAVSRLLPIIAAAQPANEEAMYASIGDVIYKYGQGESEAAQWIRDNFSPPKAQ